MPCSTTPIFFILFPGYSPSKDIEEYARKLGKTVEGGELTLISMGQGQEGPAEAVLDRCAKDATQAEAGAAAALAALRHALYCCLLHHSCEYVLRRLILKLAFNSTSEPCQ